MEDETTANRSAAPVSSYPGAFPNCRAKESGFRTNAILCLSKPPLPCRYRKMTGENYICNHPNSLEIAAYTFHSEQHPGGADAPGDLDHAA